MDGAYGAVTDGESAGAVVRARGRWRRTVPTATAIVLLTAVAVPPLRARAVAITATAEALDLPVARPFAVDVERRETVLGGVTVDRYGRQGSDDPTVVLVPGATRHGRDDARVVRLAEAVARSGRTVVVPELELYAPTLVPADVARIADVVRAAADGTAVTVVGISFGGSLALRAIGDEPSLAEHVALVVVFGAYADLVGVLQGAATGVVVVGRDAVPWEPAAEAEGILRRELLGALPAEARTLAEEALDGDRPLASVPPEVRAAVELLTHDDPSRTRAIVERLSPDLRARLRAVSPVHVADRVTVPVRILHAREDPAVPHAEGRRLVAALPDARLTTVQGFDHVDLELTSPRELWIAVRGLGGVWRLAGALLSAQEPWVPARLR